MALRVSHGSRDEAVDSNVSSYNTIKRQPRNTLKYGTRLTLSFALTAVMTAVVLSFVLAVVWERQFQAYTRDKMQLLADQMAENLAQSYEKEQDWTDEMLSYVESTSNSMSEVGIRLQDVNGTLLYDDAQGGILLSASHAEMPRISQPANKNAQVSAVIECSLRRGLSGKVSVGVITFWSVSSDLLLTHNDTAFRTSSYGAIVTAATMAVVFACVLGIFVARALTNPVKRITTTAAQIRNGDLTARTGLSGSDEIGRLGEMFDQMASTLERDIQLEHRLTSDVAHELRTPLMAMQATVEAMQDGVMPADQEHLATVAEEVRRLSRLVDAMLRLSRMENGKTPLKIDRCDVIEMTSALVSAHMQLFQDNGLELSFHNDTGHHTLMAEIDPDLIREALVNLMSNAMRYTSEGGSVSVHVGRSRRNVLIAVSDTGMGIAKEDIPRVFSRFWRSDASREREAGGLGVGLSLTKEIVDRHNGTISVDSEEGAGTTFTLKLPLAHARKRGK